MVLTAAKLILAVFLFWPRGYLLIYLIDRGKKFSFGFKFFAGWVLGLAGFSLDIFASNVFGGVKFSPLIFFLGSITQIVGFSFMIFLLERKILLPKIKNLKPFIENQKKNFSKWKKQEKIALAVLVLAVIVRLGFGVWYVDPSSGLEDNTWNDWNLRAKIIYGLNDIPVEENSIFYLGGGSKTYPLNDSIFKVYLASAANGFKARLGGFAGMFYYFLLISVFYFSLPSRISRLLKLISTFILGVLSSVFLFSQFFYPDLLFSIFLFLTIASFYYFFTSGNHSAFYFSGIILSLGIWTKVEALFFIFPAIALATLILFGFKRINFKQLFFYWFWPVITVSPLLLFFGLNPHVIFEIDYDFWRQNYIFQLLPLIVLFSLFSFQRFFGKIRV